MRENNFTPEKQIRGKEKEANLNEILGELTEEERRELSPQIAELIERHKNDRKWASHQEGLDRNLLNQTKDGEVILRFAQDGPVDNETLQDPTTIKLEAGGIANSSNLIFEHRLAPDRPIVPHTLNQILFEAITRPDEFKKAVEGKKVVLGDIDLGGTLAYWLIRKIQDGENVTQYKNLIDLVSQYDLQGRTAIYPTAEPHNSLFRVAWGIELTYGSKEERLAAYLTLFDRLSVERIDSTTEIPWHDKKALENIDQLIEFSNRKIDEAIVAGNLHNDTLLIADVPYTRAHWDEIGVQIARRFNNSRATILVSPTENPNRPVMLNSSFSAFYLALLGEQMAKEGLPVWYGAGFVGIDTRRLPTEKEFTPGEMQSRLDSYIAENRENIEGAVEFEVIFDDKEFLEKITQEALGHIITGYTKSPEYNKITAAYLWNEYGHGLKEGEAHTKVNFDEVLVLRFLVPQSLKQKAYDYFYDRIAEKWDTPLIKMTERQVPKKFAKYTEENVDQKVPRKETKLSPEQKEIISNTTLIVPDNDGEARLVIEIAKKLGMDVRMSNQAWGARLDRELQINPNILSSPKRTILVFEMPSKEVEEQLGQKGLSIEIVDHHQYQDDDRSKEESSLEQFLQKLNLSEKQLKALGFDPRFIEGVAINDKAYIYGLRQAGYTEEEIRKIREFDIGAQLKEQFDEISKRNEEIYNARTVQGDVIILASKEGDNNSIACDKIVFDNSERIPQILDLRKNSKGKIIFVYFSGPIEIVRKLKEGCSPSFGGSDKTGKVSDFVGWNNPTEKQIQEIKRALDIE